jgi:hypothetical protein
MAALISSAQPNKQNRLARPGASKIADILHDRDQLDDALRIRRDEELPVYERLGGVRNLLIGQTKLATDLVGRGQVVDTAEVIALLAAALHAARRLRIPEASQISAFVRTLGRDPTMPPFA